MDGDLGTRRGVQRVRRSVERRGPPVRGIEGLTAGTQLAVAREQDDAGLARSVAPAPGLARREPDRVETDEAPVRALRGDRHERPVAAGLAAAPDQQIDHLDVAPLLPLR